MHTFDFITEELLQAALWRTDIKIKTETVNKWKFAYDNKFHKTKKITLSGNTYNFKTFFEPILKDSGIITPIPPVSVLGGDIIIEMIANVKGNSDKLLYGFDITIEFEGEKRRYSVGYAIWEFFHDDFVGYINTVVIALLKSGDLSDQILKGMYKSKKMKKEYFTSGI